VRDPSRSSCDPGLSSTTTDDDASCCMTLTEAG
jgi:hypothetical protein